MHFNQTFLGCKAGEIYPTEFQPGEECPPELLEAALILGVVDAPKPPVKPAKKAK
jgi:hypothetical protein